LGLLYRLENLRNWIIGDYSIAASVVVTGGGDEISYSKAVVEQKDGYQDEIH
jgi:hypothetical protein